jgi:hypothetical protein
MGKAFSFGISATAFAVMALASGPSAAQPFLRGSYAGADLVFTHVDYGTINLGAGPIDAGTVFANDLWSGNVHVGMRLSDLFGIEAGYLWIPEADRAIFGGNTSSVRVQGATLDGHVYLALDAARRFEAIGLIGASWLEAEAHLNGPSFGPGVIDKQAEWSWRIGGGAQFWLSEYVSMRGLVVYQSADLNGEVDSALSTHVGVNLHLP